MRIAVIGNGIVGATFVNEMLERYPNSSIVQFDGITGTATTASAGIIAPWLSKRRNQQWYRLARKGAAYIQEIALRYNMPTDVYFKSGVIYTRDTSEKIEELLALAQKRIQNAPQMESFERINSTQIKSYFPFIDTTNDGVLVSGGARIDGKKFIEFLNKRNRRNVEFRNIRARLSRDSKIILVNGEKFDLVILASGAWLKENLELIGVNARVRPQKGQLIEIKLPNNESVNKTAPVLMPEGERDFIPTDDETMLIGATHENEQGFDLSVSEQIKQDLLASGQRLIPDLDESMITNVRVGTRAYTDDFAPFFGYLPQNQQVMIASGLGSSGLTTGPIIGKLLVDLIENPNLNVASLTKPLSTYIK